MEYKNSKSFLNVISLKNVNCCGLKYAKQDNTASI